MRKDPVQTEEDEHNKTSGVVRSAEATGREVLVHQSLE
jgi:hypothetical protein